jgi:predicted CXXCH cytochrome family protein
MRNTDTLIVCPIKGGRLMKKLSFTLVIALVIVLFSFGTAMAVSLTYPLTPSDYAPFFNPNGAGLNPEYIADNEDFSYIGTLVNANNTGVEVNGELKRTVDGQNVHTNFQKNTNSCASCHMTHSAPGPSLLFRATIFATCSACHDGTHSPNVFKPSEMIVQDAMRNNSLRTAAETVGQSVSGTFGVNLAMNASVHLATGNLTIKAAPGGNRTGLKADGTAENVKAFGSWDKEFSCSSCHVPHGTYSQRLMHYNPNNVMGRNPVDGGMRLNGLIVSPASDYPDDGYLYLFTPTVPTSTWATDPAWVSQENPSGRTGNYVQVPRTNFTKAQAVKGPWVYGYIPGGRTNPDWQYITFYKKSDGSTLPINAFNRYERDGKLKTGAGWAALGLTYNDITASVTLALVVESPTRNTTTDRLQYTQTSGMNYNIFCAACHTDYELGINNVSTGRLFDAAYANGGTAAGEPSGVYSRLHRHTPFRGSNGGMEVVASTNMICVSCHFVHGADSLIMKTADEVVIGIAANEIAAGTAPAGLLANLPNNVTELTKAGYIAANMDIGASSALKRYTNMSICWKCHTSSHANTLKNNNDVWNKYTDISTVWHVYSKNGSYR